jgi:hypothetical protein
MLRLFVSVLVLLNGLYFVWSQGWLRVFDFAPAQQTEPHRMWEQINPDALRLLSQDEQRQAEVAARTPVKPPVCLQAGVFDEAQGTALRDALAAALPKGSWVLDAVVEPARWIVYMGKFANADALLKKRTELAPLDLKFEPLGNPALEPGLSLGGYDTQAAAEVALDALTQRGVRTARVVPESTEVRGMMLKVPLADEALRSQLDGLSAVLAGKPLRRCR